MAKITTPLKKVERMVPVSYREYTAFLQWQKKIGEEMRDTDEAITIAEQEKKSDRLKILRSFSALLRPRRL